MQVNSSNIEYQRYLQRLAAEQAAAQTSAEQASSQTTAASYFSQGTDSYTSSSDSTETDMVIPSEQYNDMRPPMPPMPPQEDTDAETGDEADTASTATQTVAVSGTDDTDSSSSDSSILQTISEVMHVRTDSIQSTMDELGITEDDLTDEDKLSELLDALNQGAQQRGLPTVSDGSMQNLISELTDSTDTSETEEA